MFAEAILKHSIFNKSLALYLKKADVPTKQEIVMLMKGDNLYNIDSHATFVRRASTVSGWIDWVLLNEYNGKK